LVAIHISGNPEAPRAIATAQSKPGFTTHEAAARSAAVARANSRSVIDTSRDTRAGPESRTAVGTNPGGGAAGPPPLGGTLAGGGATDDPPTAGDAAPVAALGGNTDPYEVIGGAAAPAPPPPAAGAGTDVAAPVSAGTEPLAADTGAADTGALSPSGAANGPTGGLGTTCSAAAIAGIAPAAKLLPN